MRFFLLKSCYLQYKSLLTVCYFFSRVPFVVMDSWVCVFLSNGKSFCNLVRSTKLFLFLCCIHNLHIDTQYKGARLIWCSLFFYQKYPLVFYNFLCNSNHHWTKKIIYEQETKKKKGREWRIFKIKIKVTQKLLRLTYPRAIKKRTDGHRSARLSAS